MHMLAKVHGLSLTSTRSESDTEAVWMSGREESMFFWVLQRHTLNGEPELRKVAGEYLAPYVVSLVKCPIIAVSGK